MSNLERYYTVLGLKLGASLEEVNQAYRDLAFIWHPDRVPKDNPRLQEKAHEKLQELNQARDHLRSNVKRPATQGAARSTGSSPVRPTVFASSPAKNLSAHGSASISLLSAAV
jgi:curved DNA-binding protein CbpA